MTLFNLCTACLQNPKEFSLGSEEGQNQLCAKCRSAIEDLRTPDESPSLYFYRHPVSTLIHRAKIRDDIPALWLLANMMAKSEIGRGRAKEATHILPAPSSLWGRLRGRLDIAWISANELSKSSCKPLLEASLQSYCKFGKQARLPGSLRATQNDESNFFKLSCKSQQILKNHPPGEELHFLIIDDVITSGKTTEGLRSKLMHSYAGSTVQILTFADARRKS